MLAIIEFQRLSFDLKIKSKFLFFTYLKRQIQRYTYENLQISILH